MRKLFALAIAATIGLSAGASTSSAALSSSEAPPIVQSKSMEVARGGGRNDRGRDRDARRDRNDRPIWRIKDKDRKRERPFFLFRGRGDCRTEKIQVRDFNGNLIVRNGRVCN